MYDTINLLQLREFKRDLNNLPMVEACQKHLTKIRAELRRYYFDHSAHHQAIAPQLIYGLALDTDSIVTAVWRNFNLHLESNISLIAVGGYGRRELHPYSDIDLLIYYHKGSLSDSLQSRVQKFITALWDIDLKSSATVRSDKQIQNDCQSDITLATSLLEARLLVGNRDSVLRVKHLVYERFWSTRKFFLAKRKEQQLRHEKYNNISYQLEPDIKNSPGGLRDLQNIMWIAKHFLKGTDFERLVEEQLISPSGMRKLTRSRNFLWSMRLGVHLLSGRSEERFLIDYQRELAHLLGFEDNKQQRGVEALMQRYYKSLLAISAVCDSMMQKFEEHISKSVSISKRRLNEDFYLKGNTIYCDDERCFEHAPSNLLLCFLFLGKSARAEKLSAQCIHAIYENSMLIDSAFRAEKENTKLFIKILSLPHKQAEILELMKRYGVLGNYLPGFGKVIGQVQHDLFHIYTVDAHTLQLIRNLQNLLVQEQEKDLEIPAQVTRQLPQFLIVVVAGLFHDIAKGRGGDHSVLGAVDITEFAEKHGFSKQVTNLLAWLVMHHLRMSSTAQSKDLSDPSVIGEFADFVDNKIRLDYLYVLTVADIKATNPSLWNSWRAALLTRLYLDTRERLEKQTSPTIEAIVHDRKELALSNMPAKDQRKAHGLWKELDRDFFVNKSPENMAWQTAQILKFRAKPGVGGTLVMIRATHQLMSQGATEIAVYSQGGTMTFADIVYTLDRIGLDTQEARIQDTNDGFVYGSFIVLDREHKPLAKSKYKSVRESLLSVFSIKDRKKRPGKSKRYIPPRLHKFWFEPVINIRECGNEFYVDVNCLDCPGLLTTIAESFRSLSLEVINARIATIGEEARDSFKVEARESISGLPIESTLRKSINQLMTLSSSNSSPMTHS